MYLKLVRDYVQDFDALLLSRPSRLTVQMLAIWQDRVGRPLAKGSGAESGMDKTVDVDEAEE